MNYRPRFSLSLGGLKSPAIFSSNIYRPENTEPSFDGYCFCFDPDKLSNSLWKNYKENGITQMIISGETFQLLENPQLEIVESIDESFNNPKIFERSCKWPSVYEMLIPIKISDPLLPWTAKLDSFP